MKCIQIYANDVDVGKTEKCIKIWANGTHIDDKTKECIRISANDKVVYHVSIAETISGSCIYALGGTCSATSTYKATTNGTLFLWTVTGDGSISSGQGTDTINVTSTSNTDTYFTVTCEVNNGVSDSLNASHTRTEDSGNPCGTFITYDLIQGSYTGVASINDNGTVVNNAGDVKIYDKNNNLIVTIHPASGSWDTPEEILVTVVSGYSETDHTNNGFNVSTMTVDFCAKTVDYYRVQ